MDQNALQRQITKWASQYEEHREKYTPYSGYFELRSTEFLLLILKLRLLFDPLRWERVLEVGCGNGYGCLLWSLLADRVVGVDMKEVVSTARQLVDEQPEELSRRIEFTEGRIEDLSGIEEKFDLVITQYALEHFHNPGESIRRIHRRVAPGGHAIHIVPGTSDRHSGYIQYRASLRWWNRVRDSYRYRGLWRTLKEPLGYTASHDGTIGSFDQELENYCLEHWSALLLRHGAELVDYFSTRDSNWVLVTRIMPAEDL